MNNRLMRPQTKPPDAPRILTANQTTPRAVEWTIPASNGSMITECRIYGNNSLTDVTPGDQTQWITPAAGQLYAVSAVNAVGEGKRSKAVRATCASLLAGLACGG